MEQNAGKKRTRLNLEQRDALLSFMEKNPALATGRFPGPQGSKIKAQLWNELSDYLNSIGAMGHGTTKTPDRWIKSWQDWRCDVKAKAWRLRQNGVNPGTAQLTPIEERLLAFMGNECQEEHLMLDPLDVPSGHYSDDNTHEYTLAISDSGALTVDISSPSPSDSHNLSPVASSSVSPPVTCLAQSTSSYLSQRQMKSEQSSSILSPNQAHSPVAQDRNLSPINKPFTVNVENISLALRKRRRQSHDKEDQSENPLDEDERAVYYAERLASAMKVKASAMDLEAAAEERRATAAERKATALEREAAAAERQAAAVERQAAAAERLAAAVEKEVLCAERKSMLIK